MVLSTTLLLAGGLVLLLGGAELLVRGAVGLARTLGISPVVIGLTVVAFGTSAPEVAVTAVAAVKGQPDLAVGNVLGSNVFNVFAILGLSALLTPLVVAQKVVRIDAPLTFGAGLLVWALAADGVLGRLEGIGLLLALLAYVVWTVRSARRTSAPVAAEYGEAFGGAPPRPGRPLLVALLLVGAGLGLVVLGSDVLVRGAVQLATMLGVSELVVGLTIVSAGTSLPEVATSVVAALKGERDIAVGNVVGSNLFNLLGVLGVAGVLAPAGVAVSGEVLQVDLPVMLAALFVCVPVLFSGFVVDRLEGLLFLVWYAAYVGFVVLRGTGSAALPGYGTLLGVLVPATALLLLVPLLRHRRSSRRSS